MYAGQMSAIDLNADIGESYGRWKMGDDVAMLSVVSSANIACGSHAGDPSTMRRCCVEAAASGVVIGAHFGYPDLAGFGRRFVDIDPQELRDVVLFQLGALDGFAQVAGAGVAYAKPHGALYHACTGHEQQAVAVAAALHEFDPSLAVLCAPGSLLLELIDELGMEAVAEGFADRRYDDAGRLVGRSQPGAVIDDPVACGNQAVTVATKGVTVTTDATVHTYPIRSLCVHGDSPGAVARAREVKTRLEADGLRIAPFGL